MKVNKHVKDEIRSAPEIRKLQKKKEQTKLKNMNKDQRKKVMAKSNKAYADKQKSMLSQGRPNSRSKAIVKY